MANILKISEANEKNFPFKASTLYKWHRAGLYPSLFVKIGGKVFIDLDEFEKLGRGGNGLEEKKISEAIS